MLLLITRHYHHTRWAAEKKLEADAEKWMLRVELCGHGGTTLSPPDKSLSCGGLCEAEETSALLFSLRFCDVWLYPFTAGFTLTFCFCFYLQTNNPPGKRLNTNPTGKDSASVRQTLFQLTWKQSQHQAAKSWHKAISETSHPAVLVLTSEVLVLSGFLLVHGLGVRWFFELFWKNLLSFNFKMI